ncbi:MAG: metal ABC transporter ATP-binding protein [Candidatus Limnocylindrus sp.]|jgi:ABC-type Mn2+/Zn2+ transport system ATPase subunit
MKTAAVMLNGVTAGYGDRAAIQDVNLAIAAGSLTAIFGPNGGGKSTLLKCIAGLMQPWSGSIAVLGGPVGRFAQRVAYVPQAEQVDWSFPVSVDEVVMMGRTPMIGIGRSPQQRDRDQVAMALDRVEMGHLSKQQVGALSGGQRRRVFLARAIAADPEIYLLDEPVTGVDPVTQEKIMNVLDDEAARGRTVIATTHDLACAAQRFHDVVALAGRIVVHGKAQLVLDREVLEKTYGGHLVPLAGGGVVLLDDPHHSHGAHEGHE